MPKFDVFVYVTRQHKVLGVDAKNADAAALAAGDRVDHALFDGAWQGIERDVDDDAEHAGYGVEAAGNGAKMEPDPMTFLEPNDAGKLVKMPLDNRPHRADLLALVRRMARLTGLDRRGFLDSRFEIHSIIRKAKRLVKP